MEINMSFVARHKIPLLLLLFALLVFGNLLGAERLRTWDDNRYLDECELVQNFQVGRILTEPYFGAYIPVTLLAYALEYKLWGGAPAGYHAVNLLFHALNGVLVFFFLNLLIKRRLPAMIGALLFICHPVQVETVAWITQLKNILSMFFFMLALISHIHNRQTNSSDWQWKTWFFYFIAVLSKSAVVGAPILFMAYDYFWAKLPWRRILLSAVIPIAIAAFGTITTLMNQAGIGGIQEYWGGSRWSAFQLTFLVTWEYLVALINPGTLSIHYLYFPSEAINANWRVWAGFFLLLTFTVASLYSLIKTFRDNTRPPLTFFFFLWVAVFMLPVSNIIPISIQRADRYLYFPSVMIFLYVGIALEWLWQRFQKPYARYAIGAAATAVILFFAIATYQQNKVWTDDGTLWRAHLAKYPKDDVAMNNLAMHYYMTKEFDKAIPIYIQLVQIDPYNYKPPLFLGLMALEQGYPEKAVAALTQALPLAITEFEKDNKSSIEHIEAPMIQVIKENLIKAYGQAITAAEQEGRNTEQLVYYQDLTKIMPDDPNLYNNMGQVHQRMGEMKAAVESFEKAMEISKEYNALAHANIGYVKFELGELDEARKIFEEGLEQDPTARAALGLCEVMGKKQKHDAAADACFQAVALSPNTATCYDQLVDTLLRSASLQTAAAQVKRKLANSPDIKFLSLGELFMASGDPKAALEHYKQSGLILAQLKIGQAALALKEYSRADEAFGRVIEDSPDFVEAIGGKCLALSQLEHPQNALQFCRTAAERMPKDVRYLSVYAELLATGDRPDKAISLYRKAITLKPQQQNLHHALGDLLISQKQFKEAIDCFNKVLALDENDALALANKGIAFHEMGNNTDAKTAFEQALKLNSQLVPALEGYCTLLQESGGDATEICRRAQANRS